MSHSTYNTFWDHAQVELNDLLLHEVPAQPPRPERDRVVFFQRLATLYVRYVQIFRQLEECYDQMVHPQKRRVIREVLDGVMGRVLELKNEMVEKEFSEYHYMDDVVQDLKLTPEDIEIPIPRYFISERSKVLQDRGKVLSKILNKMEVVEKPKSVGLRALNLEEAIKIIQVSERARQGRLRAKFMREIQRDEERQGRAKDRDLGAGAIDIAAVRIQKTWKGYIQRKKTRKEREEEMLFLGMALDQSHTQPYPAKAAALANQSYRRAKQKEHEEDYQKSIVTITKKLREVEGPDMRETMKDQIRQWFIECHDATGTFPDYPDEEDGGSSLIFAEKTPQQLIEELAAKEEEDANKKPKGKEEKKEKGKKEKGKAGEEEEEPGLKMLPSGFLSDLEVAHKTFAEVWQNRSESKNFSQRHEAELIKEEKRKEIEVEVRLQVDELMRQELANWKLAVDKDKGGKAKGNAKKKKGSKSGKKKKKDKDLTADRTVESLYQELVEQGLLKQADPIKLKEYIGDYSYLGTTLRQTDIEPMPSLSDVRQIMTLYAVLPLGKYPGKNGLALMLHMVFKVARLMQPSVVWIGNAEKMFYKKVPKEEKELDPKRLKKDLPKILKSIKGEDRVLVVGTTRDPLSADLKSLCKVYNKIVLIPRPDYASRYVMWKQLIRKCGGEVTRALDLSSLAKISDGYTQGHMVQVLRRILTERRVQQLAKRPLTAAEFVAPLAKIDPVFQDEEEALKSWYAKTPLGKKRAKAASGKEGEEEAPTKGGKDTKKKGKK
ncbi:dynein regulatory complex protein 11 isoform X3 [Osmerus eperlanus]|uniref:dynein regulatory complex protein 11 isoform X3 n=1 Tax=Osmerus eperlanus TaxID=29151 RepID=UPI002E0F0369